jgi:hypothetical protein
MISLAAIAIVLAGCGSDDAADTPTACLAPAADYVEALEAAPEAVRLAGGTAISDCLVEEQDAGALAEVGGSMVDAAERLNARVLRTDDRQATVALGYLVGAVQEGAAGTGGIHADLVLRLDAAARFTGERESFPASFERRFGGGYAAGQESG